MLTFSDLPTSRLARKRLATKGFGAGGVAPTPPVNLPSESRPYLPPLTEWGEAHIREVTREVTREA